MGYDMYIEVTEGADVGIDFDPYFRLNIWGMGKFRQLAMARGAVTGQPMPRWPDREDYVEETTEDEESEMFEGLREPSPYVQAIFDVRDGQPEPVMGIPIYKLGSNDGWLVTPAECKVAAVALKLSPFTASEFGQEEEDGGEAESEANYYNAFAAWIETAGELGGFRVH